MKIDVPPYSITPPILDLVARIAEAIGQAEAAAVPMSLRLRRINRIRAIQGSLAIEGNTLTEEEISTILEAVLDSRSTDQEGDYLTDQVVCLINALRNGPGTARELMAVIGLSHRPTFRNNYIHPALDAGLVEMTHPESPTARNQRYRLTARGQAAARLHAST